MVTSLWGKDGPAAAVAPVVCEGYFGGRFRARGTGSVGTGSVGAGGVSDGLWCPSHTPPARTVLADSREERLHFAGVEFGQHPQVLPRRRRGRRVGVPDLLPRRS